MNKYKMISILSFVIACILVLSLLLPIKTIANDKESLELSMNYENSKVTVNITVNSDIYTGVVCKYIIIDDVLKSDDLLTQTKEQGTTINLDKSENDKYTTVIENVNKRYIVIYVTIGNCSLCDYLDCQPSDPNKNNLTRVEEPANVAETPDQNIGLQGESQDGQQIEKNNNTSNQEQTSESKSNNNNETTNQEKNDNAKTEEKQKVENKQEEKSENKQEEKSENKQEAKAENKQEVKAENNQETKSENKQNDKIVVDNKTTSKSDSFEKIEESTNSNTNNNTQIYTKSTADENKKASSQEQVSNSSNAKSTDTKSSQSATSSKRVIDFNTYSKDSVNVSSSNNGDKDSVNTSSFQEIGKTTSTVSGNMPKTGEDDFVKILGIIVFSALSNVSFYKYKKTK